jgi:ubiquinone biosynthesis UbiH/UbiF/VisC/COQ6 family hydroxylase
MTAPQHEVVVVGGGPVGAALALALQPLDVALIEPHPPQALPAQGFDLRVYAVSPGNIAFLERLGVWGRIDPARIQPVAAMAIYGDRDGGRLQFRADEAGLPALAAIVEAAAIQQALDAAIAETAALRRCCPAQVAAIELAAVQAAVTLTDAGVVTAQLLIGCDGRDSTVRRAAAIEVRESDYGQLGVVAHFETGEPHRGTAFQWFRGDGVLALLPLPGQRVSMVWSTPREPAQALLGLDPAALAQTVGAASGGILGELKPLTAAAGFPLRYSRVPRLVAPRLALAGDAAHSVHPLAGQGLNLGFRDVRELAAVLRSRVPRQDCGDYALLRRYERARREDIATTGLLADALLALFASRSGLAAAVRNSGLGALNGLTGLKSLLIRHAAA